MYSLWMISKTIGRDEWGGEGFNTTEDNDENGHVIPNEICKKIKNLVDEHTAGRLRAEDIDSSFFCHFFGLSRQREYT